MKSIESIYVIDKELRLSSTQMFYFKWHGLKIFLYFEYSNWELRPFDQRKISKAIWKQNLISESSLKCQAYN